MTSSPKAPTVAAPSSGRAVRLVVVLGVLVAVAPLSVDLYLPALPELRDELGASDALVQFTVTGMLLGLGLGQLVVGPLSDTLGRRRPLLVGLLVHALASFACAVASSIELLLGIRLVQGLAAAAVAVVTMATVRDRFEGQAMAKVMSRMILVASVAPILAPTVGGQLLHLTDWRGIFFILSGLVLVIAVVAFFVLDESLPGDRRQSSHPRRVAVSYGLLVKDRTFIPLALIGGLSAAAAFSYISGSSLVLQDGFGVSSQTFAVLFGLNAIAMLAGAQLNPVLNERFPLVRVMQVANLLGVVAALTVVGLGVAEVGGVAGFVIPMALIMGATSMVLPSTAALALHKHGVNAGAAAAVLGCIQFGTGALIAPLVGAAGAATAVPLGVVMAASLAAAGMLLFLASRDRELRGIGGPSNEPVADSLGEGVVPPTAEDAAASSSPA